MRPQVTAFFDDATFTVTYVVTDPASKAAVIIDSVLGYDPKSGWTNTEKADEVVAFVRAQGLEIAWILETHVHADHLTAAPYLKENLGGQTGIGDRIGTVQQAFKDVFNLDGSTPTNGSQFDHLFTDGEIFAIGSLEARVMHSPGHTPACATYVIGDAAFVGDTLFMPDYGTARADFPGGDARILFRSIKQTLSLPPETRLFMCHDYAPNGREYLWETTVAEQNATNIHIKDGVSEDDYVTMRTARDEKLAVPVLLLPAVQINMRAGHLPPPESNGVSYLKIPLNTFR
ncbi:MAG: MBL fold metallo-hydrolase [Proteobacteria bacterium]|nr:MBL fold metallo-hydrolase [Pseudomonadota bacterium]MDA1058337.1 MBL fold metallo-hydrolase [Pseudomonadota bacterium]